MTREFHPEPKVHHKKVNMLLESSLRSIPFNIVLSALLVINLHFNNVPALLFAGWFLTICSLSIIRWIYSIKSLRNQIVVDFEITRIFTVLTFLMGAVWGLSYFIFQPYINFLQEFIIILVLGGMSSGAIASLCIYLPAYYAYILPMILPIVLYNFFQFETDRIIIGTMLLLFLLMLFVTARINSRLLQQNFRLANEKDWMIDKLNQINVDLESTNEKLTQSIEEIRTMSVTDSLTGLYNRRHFNNMLKNELDRAKRNGHTLNLILIDIDNFKYINDTYGHPVGDDFLIKVTASLKKSLRRANDAIFRLGGDEFSAILTNISLDEANFVCDGIQRQFKKDIDEEKVTLSLGVISIPPDHTSDLKHLISSADKSLYQAKKEGKNRVVVSRLM